MTAPDNQPPRSDEHPGEGAGRIYYDADGDGAKVLFAQVTAGLALTHADLDIVG